MQNVIACILFIFLFFYSLEYILVGNIHDRFQEIQPKTLKHYTTKKAAFDSFKHIFIIFIHSFYLLST